MSTIAAGARLEGFWRIVAYVTGGRTVPVMGSLLIADGRWSVLYLVPQPGGAGLWGSAEAGWLAFDGEHLTLYHELTFQGGGGREIFITQASQVVEVCTIDLDATSLAIAFPSGNIVRCERATSG